MCPRGTRSAAGRCSRPAATAWCSPCSSCCCATTSSSTPSRNCSARPPSSSWCSSCECGGWGRAAGPCQCCGGLDSRGFALQRRQRKNIREGKFPWSWGAQTRHTAAVRPSDKGAGYGSSSRQKRGSDCWPDGFPRLSGNLSSRCPERGLQNGR